MTPLTSLECSTGCLSHSHGMPGAASVMALSTSPHAWLRFAGSLTTSALSISELTFGSLSWAKFELPTSRMFLPLNTGPSRVSGSAKSLSQPTLGQIGGSAFLTWQNFVYIESRVTALILTLNPSLPNCCCATWVTFSCCVALSDTASNVPPPVYLPDG